MLHIKKQLIALIFLLLLISAALFTEHMGISWYPWLDLHSSWAQMIYALSASLGGVGLIITLLIGIGLSIGPRPICLKRLGALLICLFIALAVAWSTKTVIKQATQEPRPYLTWLAQQGQIPATDEFYRLAPKQRSTLITQLKEPSFPPWLQQHLATEINYAFPSGHAIAAITLVMFFLPIWLNLRRHVLLQSLLILWGIGVCYSRVLLGLHWPGDVMTSALLGSLIGLVMGNLFLLYQNSQDSNRPGRRLFSKRDHYF